MPYSNCPVRPAKPRKFSWRGGAAARFLCGVAAVGAALSAGAQSASASSLTADALTFNTARTATFHALTGWTPRKAAKTHSLAAGFAVTNGFASPMAGTTYTGTFPGGSTTNFSAAGLPAGGSTTADTLVFTTSGTGAAIGTDDIANPLNANNLTFSNTVALTLNQGAGTTITLGGTNPTVNLSNTAAVTDNLNTVLAANTTFTGNGAGGVTLGGTVSGTGGLTKSGTSTLTINNSADTYTGGTTVNGGTLAYTAPAQLGTGSVVTPFGTGLINLSGGSTLSLKANGQNNSVFELFQVPNSLVLSGSATLSTDRTTQGGNKFFQFNSLDLGANTLTVNSGDGYNVTIAGTTKVLNGAGISDTGGVSNNGISAVNLNALTVSNAAATNTISVVTLGATTATVPINVYGRITNNGADTTKTLGILKTGAGVLELRGNNTFSGGLTATGGIVRLYNTNALGTGNTSLSGAVLEGTRDDTSFTQTLGTGAGQLQFTSSTTGAGFGAYGANVTVNLNSGAGLVWNSTTGFNLGTGNLILNGSDIGGPPTGTGTLTFQNALDLNSTSTARVIETDGGTANISGNITNSAGSTAQLTKTGGNIGNVGVA